jgi:hypothetical protein
VFRAHLHRIKLKPDEQSLAERLRGHVDVLASLIGPRHLGRYDMLLAAERYVETRLALTHLPVQRQTYTVHNKPVANLFIEQPGQKHPDEIVIVGAHYDSVYCTPGADDNASAVAGMLEIALALSKQRFQRTIRCVGFVNEEPPYYKTRDMGSYRYAAMCRQRGDNIVGMINLEMIGYYSDEVGSQTYPSLGGLQITLPRRGNFIAICSDMASAGLLARFALGFRRSVRFPMIPFASPGSVTGPDMSDNWSFWQHDYPALMITDTSMFRNPHYHQPSDQLQTLHLPAMTRVVSGLIGAVGKLAGRLPKR